MKHIKSILIVLVGIFYLAGTVVGAPKNAYIPPYGIAHDHWAYPYMEKLSVYGISMNAMEHSSRPATRLELVEGLSKSMSYLEKKDLLIGPFQSPEAIVINDVPFKSEYYPYTIRVTQQYKLYSLDPSGALEKGKKISSEELLQAVTGLLGLARNLQEASPEALSQIAKTRIMTLYLPGQKVARNELLAVLVKTMSYIEKLPPAKIATKKDKAELKEAGTSRVFIEDVFVPSFSMGGLMGQVIESQSGTNNFSLYGGEIDYQQPLSRTMALEITGFVNSYQLIGLVPQGAAAAANKFQENRYDLQVNTKHLVSDRFLSGVLASVYGLRGMLLDSEVGTNMLGIRGGFEYRLPANPAGLGYQAWVGATAKLYSGKSVSVLGDPSADVDYGVQVDYVLYPGQTVSLNYHGDSLYFSQSYLRAFNTLMVKSGWLW